MIRLIAAIDRRRGLAKHGIMPWNIPEDEQYFTDQTKSRGGIVLTGSRTFREAYLGKPLAGRQNYILTRDTTPIKGVSLVHDLAKFLEDFKERDVWIAGGANVFTQIIESGRADELYLTLIDADFGCDQFFPAYESGFKLIERSEPHQQNGFSFTYARYARPDPRP
jgi:dihydrofolate reductase